MKMMIQKTNPAMMKLTERKADRMVWGSGTYFIAGSEIDTKEKLGALLLIQNSVNLNLLDKISALLSYFPVRKIKLLISTKKRI